MDVRLEQVSEEGLDTILPTDEEMQAFEAETRENFRRVAYWWHAEAVKNAPRSPTASLLKKLARGGGTVTLGGKGKSVKPRTVSMTFFYRASAAALARMKNGTLGGTAGSLNAWKKLRRDTDKVPGGLERSIDLLWSDERAEVYVAANAEAGEYAKVIHDEKGRKWKERGPGTQAKGDRADEKFIERAQPGALARFADAMKKTVQRLFRV